MSTVVTLDYTARPWQRAMHRAFRSGKRFVVVATHRRGGKTRAALMQLLDAALRTTLEAALYCYVAPFRTQAKQIAWLELKRIVAHLGPLVVDISESDLAITFKHNGARIALFGADNADSLRGLRLDGAVLDEFAHIDPEAWHAVIQPALADRGGWALFIGTPAGIDAFSELFFAAADKPGWQALRFTVYDTQSLPSGEVARLQRDTPPQAFAREFLCDFSASGDDQLISLGDVEAAAHRRYRRVDYEDAARVVGVDVARFGGDRTVIFRRQGLQAFEPLVLTGADNMTVAARVADTINQWRADACFIDVGGGAGVLDRLRQLNFNAIEVAFGGRAMKPDLYVNRRMEMWNELATWLRAGGAIPDSASLKLELATPRFSFDAHGRRVLESKDQIKKRINAGSPDLADALALTFAAPVAGRGRRPVDTSGFEFLEGIDAYTGMRRVMFVKPPEGEPPGPMLGHDPYAHLR